MLRKFKITIDGTEYEVEMEEIGGSQVVAQPAPQQQPVAPAAPVAAPVAAPQPSADQVEGTAIDAPMPGTILKVLVKVGDTVEANQPLLILEAMKMENEVVASANGTVKAINVTTGQSVDSGDSLVVIG